MEALALILLAAILLPLLIIVWTGKLFWKHSRLIELTLPAGYKPVPKLVLFASLWILAVYGLAAFITQPTGGGHARTPSFWAWEEWHSTTSWVVVVLGAAIGLLLLLIHSRRAASSFGVAVLLVVGSINCWWYLTHHREEKLQRAVLTSFREGQEAGGQEAVKNAFYNRLDAEEAPSNSVSAPEFPGGILALDKEIRALMLPDFDPPDRLHMDAEVVVECVVEADGQITLPHIKKSMGYGYDEEALRIVRNLPKFSPAHRYQDGKPVAVVWSIGVAFRRAEK